MGLEDQGRIKEVIAAQGSADTVVLLGSGDPEAAELYAETVMLGDPTFAGPLTGVALGLSPYFITEEVIKRQIPEGVYEEEVAMMEMVMPSRQLQECVARVRSRGGEGRP
jgi:betaine reductase